jgi:hypothetical protein
MRQMRVSGAGALALPLVGVSIGLLATPAAATPITLVADYRYVQAGPYAQFPFPPFSYFEGSVADNQPPFGAAASQDTSVSESGMGGSLFSSSNGFSAISVFDIIFDADLSAAYDLSGTASSSGGGLEVLLEDQTEAATLFQSSTAGPFADAGTLAAGNRYRLRVSSLSGGAGSGSVNFTFTVVPEPSSLALVGIGLLGLALQRRRPGSRGTSHSSNPR